MASDNQWAFDIETKIVSIIKNRCEQELQKTYPNIYITNKQESTSKAVFPTVLIHELPGVEQGADLEGSSINAVLETIQVDVTTNKSQSEAKRVLARIADEFKHMRFQITSMPEFNNSGDTFRSTARFRRIIGANDIL